MRAIGFVFLAACAPVGGIMLSPTPDVFNDTQRAALAINEAIGAEKVVLGTGGLHVTLGDQPCGFFDGLIIQVSRECVAYGRDASECVIVHEVGHALGIGHSQDQKSVMYPSFQSGRTLKMCADSLAQEMTKGGP